MKLRPSLIFVFVSMAALSSAVASPQTDSEDQLIDHRLRSLSSPEGGQTIDCGSTTMNKPGNKASLCARAALGDGKPFHILYSGPTGFFHSAYALASDAVGNVYTVEYDSRDLLNLGLQKRSQVFDGNRIKVTPCIKPIRLGSTEEGILACIRPVNEQESQGATRQKPIETTVCAILEHPLAFNNRMVRIHGYASGNFEYSELGADGCSDSLWFVYGNGEGPPDLVAYVMGGARSGAEDVEGKLILPVPVKLVENLSFRRFQRLMRARAKADQRSLKENPTTFALHRVAATFIGRIDGVSDDVRAFHLKRKETDRVDYLGFGQMGLFDAQFVLQSVENDAVLEAFPPIPLTQ